MAEDSPPAGTETFDLGELFYSTTDERGFIRSGNSVFIRVSRFEAHELDGKPHNIIRHPDMPRVVFRELWDHLQAGAGIGAYVVNQAKDGSPYWVFAVVRPIPGGHLSVRLKPTTPYFSVVASLYQELRAAEDAIEDGALHRSEAMEASASLLGQRLGHLGFDDYDTFMRIATIAEVTARRTAINDDPDTYGTTPAGGLAAFLDDQLGSVEAYLSLNQHLSERSSNLIALTKETSLLGFNVKVAASRLGGDGAPLQALAGLMQQTGSELVERARALAERLDSTRSTLEHVGFWIAVASLQNDMSTLLESEGPTGLQGDENQDLMDDCLRHDLQTVSDALRTIESNLANADHLAQDLVRSLRTLDAVTRNGQVEATRTTGAGFFVALFERAQALVATGLNEARSIANAVNEFGHNRAAIDVEALVPRSRPNFTDPAAGRPGDLEVDQADPATTLGADPELVAS